MPTRRPICLGEGAPPFEIKANIHSSLALRLVGEGTLDEQWAGRQHWRMDVNFSDFQMSEIHDDEGRPWISISTDFTPRRLSELIRYVFEQTPQGSNTAAFAVTQSYQKNEAGENSTCFVADRPTPPDGFPRHYGWCFDNSTGLLTSEDVPLNTHVAFSHYVLFNGKQCPTQIEASIGALSFLTVRIEYKTLDPQALKQLAPTPAMKREVSRPGAPNPEDIKSGKFYLRPTAEMPDGEPADHQKAGVILHGLFGIDGHPLDVEVERTPSLAMAEAALEASRKWRMSQTMVADKPVHSETLFLVQFTSSQSADPSASPNR